jgi:hypothetical protein
MTAHAPQESSNASWSDIVHRDRACNATGANVTTSELQLALWTSGQVQQVVRFQRTAVLVPQEVRV